MIRRRARDNALVAQTGRRYGVIETKVRGRAIIKKKQKTNHLVKRNKSRGNRAVWKKTNKKREPKAKPWRNAEKRGNVSGPPDERREKKRKRAEREDECAPCERPDRGDRRVLRRESRAAAGARTTIETRAEAAPGARCQTKSDRRAVRTPPPRSA